jgi:hypothetical protein
VALTEWHLAGPTLVTFIVALTQRMRLSRAGMQEFLHDWLGLELSTATINQPFQGKYSVYPSAEKSTGKRFAEASS